MIWSKPRGVRFQKTAQNAFKILRRQPRNFENVTSVARQRKLYRGFGYFCGCSPPFKKKRFQYTKIHSLVVNGLVTASSHALWRVIRIKVIRLLGHCWFDTPHIHTFEGDSVLYKLFTVHCHGHAEWLKLCQQKRFPNASLESFSPRLNWQAGWETSDHIHPGID